MEGRKGIESMKKLLLAIVSAIVVASFSGVAFGAAKVIYTPKFGWAITTNYAGEEQKEVKASYKTQHKELKKAVQNEAATPNCVCMNNGATK